MIIRANNFFEVWVKLNEAFVQCDDSNKLIWNSRRQEYYLEIPQMLIRIKSPTVPSLYLEDLFYSSRGSKISHLLNKYLDLPRTHWWLDQIDRWDRVDSPLFLPTKNDHLYNKNCIIGFSFKTSPKPRLTVLYRALEMPAKGGADFFLISAIAQEVMKRIKERTTVVIFSDVCWVTSRTARIYLMYKYPEKIIYSHHTFNKVVQEGWEVYFMGSKTFLSTSGKRLQKACRSLMENQPKRIDQEVFYQKFKLFLEGK